MMTTLLLAKHDNKSLKDSTNKALTAAKALGGDVHVLVAGKGCRGVAEEAAKLDGVTKVLLAESDSLEHRLAEPTAALIVSLADKYDALVAPATTTGKNVMPRVAALLGERVAAAARVGGGVGVGGRHWRIAGARWRHHRGPGRHHAADRQPAVSGGWGSWEPAVAAGRRKGVVIRG